MRRIIFELAIAVAAALLAEAIMAGADLAGSAMHWFVVGLVFVGVFATAVLSGRRLKKSNEGRRTRVGSGIKTKGTYRAKNLRVDSSDRDVEAVSDIKAEKDVHIEGIDIGPEHENH